VTGQGFCRFLAGYHGNDFESDEIRPLNDPTLKERDVIAFHQLKDPAQVGLSSTAHKLEAVWGHSPFVLEPPIDGFTVLIAEIFNDHEQHTPPRFRLEPLLLVFELLPQEGNR
jgi:hypothetical protein